MHYSESPKVTGYQKPTKNLWMLMVYLGGGAKRKEMEI